jgi:hypothetical protein
VEIFLNMSKSSDPKRLNNVCVCKGQWPSRPFLNVEVFTNDREFSDIEIFQHSGKGIPLFITGHKNLLAIRIFVGTGPRLKKMIYGAACKQRLRNAALMHYHIWHLSYEQHLKEQLCLYCTWRFTLCGVIGRTSCSVQRVIEQLVIRISADSVSVS